MTDKIKDGGPAFPRVAPTGYVNSDNPDALFWEMQKNGMSKREWLAGMALIGVVMNLKINHADTLDGNIVAIAKTAYVIADGMLAESERGKK